MKHWVKDGRRVTGSRRTPRWWPLAMVWLAACATDEPVHDDQPEIVLARPGDTLGIFPVPGDTGLILGRVNGLALANDEESVYVLDEGDHRIHRIDLDGNLLASMGREGEGPGELEAPFALQAAEGGGVWVLDNRNERATHFGPDGSIVGMIRVLGFAFAPLHDGILIPAGGSGQDTEALLTFADSARATNLTNPPDVPRALRNSSNSPHPMTMMIAPIAPGEIAIVLNGSDLPGWRGFVDVGSGRVDSLVALRVPADVRRQVGEVVVEPGAQLIAVSRIGMAGGRLWAVSVGLAGDPVAFSIPLTEGEPSFRVPAEGLHNWREGLVVKDVIVLDDRMIVAMDIEVLVLGWSAESG